MAKHYLGLDIGTKRIGVAVGDDEVRIATPLPVVGNDTGNETAAINHLVQLVHDYNIDGVVAGRPRSTRGDLTPQTAYSEHFLDSLMTRLKSDGTDTVSATLQDESSTSVLAEKRLRASKHFKESMLKDGTLDSEAASIILTDYLESLQ